MGVLLLNIYCLTSFHPRAYLPLPLKLTTVRTQMI